LLLQALDTVRRERLLMEEIDYTCCFAGSWDAVEMRLADVRRGTVAGDKHYDLRRCVRWLRSQGLTRRLHVYLRRDRVQPGARTHPRNRQLMTVRNQRARATSRPKAQSLKPEAAGRHVTLLAAC
jgi:hypothetical protein